MRESRSTVTGRRHCFVASVVIGLVAAAAVARPSVQTTAFTYQGVLRQSGAPMNGSVDLQFRLFDAAGGGTQVGATIPINAVSVTDGLIAQTLDFGALALNGEERWIEIAVAAPANGGTGPFTTLAPRQKISSTPYAAFALNALLPATYGGAVNFANAANAFTGTHSGNGSALTSLNPANLSSGTAGISISGNAASATTAGNVSGVVAVANGGTGATSAATARTNLGAAAASHAHAAIDITSGNLDVARAPSGGAWSLSSNLNFDSNTLVIDQAGNRVGIGTATPTFPLDVTQTPPGNNINPVAIFRQSGATSSAAAVRFQNTANNHFNLGITAGNEFALGYNNNISLATDLLRIAPGGNVGIGGTSPEARLHVNMAETGNPVVLTAAPLMLESMADNWISMMTDAADLSGIAFGRPGATMTEVVHGGIVYNDALAGGMEFRTGGNATRMEIASNGDMTWRDSTGAAAALLDVDGLGSAAEFRLNSADGLQLRTRLYGDGVLGGGQMSLFNDTSAETVKIAANDVAGTIDVRDGVNSVATVRLLGGSGTVFANEVRYNNPVARSFSISGNCFTPTSDNVDYVCAPDLRALSGTQVSFNAAVHVPDGARFTGMEIVVYDNDATENVTAYLERMTDGGSDDIISGSITSSSGTGATARTFASTPLNVAADNDLYAYHVHLVWNVPATATNIRIYKVKVLYEVSYALP